MSNRIYLLLGLFFLTLNLSAQSFKIDQLYSQSDENLLNLYDQYIDDSLNASKIANVYIDKSKQKNDSIEIARAYFRLAQVSKIKIAIKYLDSSIAYTLKSKNIDFPAQFYIVKSQYLFGNNEYERSLQNAISAYNNATIKNNIEQQISSLHQMNLVNELWGDYRKVLETEYFIEKLISKNNGMGQFYQQSLFALEGIGKCFVRLKKPDSALIYFNKGISKALKKKDTKAYYDFVSRTGMALTLKGNYQEALDSLTKGNNDRVRSNKSHQPYYYYYLGTCYYNLGEEEKGIAYLKRIDSVYENNHILSPELPDVYDKLINYFQKQNRKQEQLKYLYKLIQIERIIDVKRTQIIDKTNEDYYIPKIINEKERIITDLNIKNENSIRLTWWILSFLVISVISLIYYINRQKKFKKRFNKIINQQIELKSKNDKSTTLNNDISITIIEEILTSLNKFELNKSYLKSNISLNIMAKQFGTNSTYLSKVINLKKDKNFSQYINDLRIDYAIEQFEINTKFRKYTIKAIAGECGFKNAESFSKAFYKKWGIYPSYYLKQLKDKN